MRHSEADALPDPPAFFIYYEMNPPLCVIFPTSTRCSSVSTAVGLLGLLKVLLYRREITGLRV